ncbi:nitroreductase [Paenibacillus psychroresistens]|uniref:Nitroreductase n=1 Tax=Paenibacillus psychroresistens TaxID=1778678 RepID=A0A6B8RLF7_9BACL|nr:nitroreductase family protein [Paenibacillus psychroresistens]QGQ96355.1 nitroreductase [Paenibacillus psychroresistens]
MSNSSYQTFDPTEKLFEIVELNRKSEHAVSPLFLNRWSPRSYTEQKVTKADLNRILEAARWAPSASNLQPWRFYIAASEEQLLTFQQFIKPNNRLWTDHAPVLVLLTSAKLNAVGEPSLAHAFDTGAAWAQLALQATLLGLVTHAVGGFDRDKARELLQVPDDFEIHAIITIGYQGNKEDLAEALQEREKPNNRRPLSESIVEWKIDHNIGKEATI